MLGINNRPLTNAGATVVDTGPNRGLPVQQNPNVNMAFHTANRQVHVPRPPQVNDQGLDRMGQGGSLNTISRHSQNTADSWISPGESVGPLMNFQDIVPPRPILDRTLEPPISIRNQREPPIRSDPTQNVDIQDTGGWSMPSDQVWNTPNIQPIPRTSPVEAFILDASSFDMKNLANDKRPPDCKYNSFLC